MKTLYIDCSMGAAGDMLMAALLELVPNKDVFLSKMNGLGIPGVQVEAERKTTCGIEGGHIRVLIHGEEEGCGHDHGHHHEHHEQHEQHEHHEQHEQHAHHHHSGLADIKAIINGLELPEKVRKDAIGVYEIIAGAESRVHGQDMEHIHFHEVGTLDAIADVVGNCLLFELIGAQRICASPVHVGSGTVKCAHGLLPVPAPATAMILQGIPIYGGEVKGELCTPTGAALLKYFADDFGPMPQMRVAKTGYGVGTKDFGQANCVRIMAGDTDDTGKDQVCELAANIDDMTAEEIGYAIEVLMEKGALDVYAENIVMKKSRPAIKLVCMCRCEDKDDMAALMLKHTTTIGVREYRCQRYTMDRRFEQRKTPWGDVNVKVCEDNGVKKIKAEFEDLARIARKEDLSIFDVKKEIHE